MLQAFRPPTTSMSPELARLGRDSERLTRQLSGLKQPRVPRDGAAEIDPQRHFGAVNYRTAKGSLDHLVGAREERSRHIDAERLGGDQVHDETELGWLLDRNVGRFLAAKNLIDKVARALE